jgi:class 3 adenylate cyclase
MSTVGQRKLSPPGFKALPARLAVHIAARVAALAQTGEVLVSGMVKDLVVGSGIEFGDRGEHELKGVPGSWKLFAVED